MKIRKEFNFSHLLLYFLFACAQFCLFHIGDNAEPVGLALAYATANAGLSPALSFLLYLLPAIPFSNVKTVFIYIAQGALLSGGFYLQRKSDNNFIKTGFPSLLCLTLSLCGFVVFADFTAYPLPFAFSLDEVFQKVLWAAAIFLLAATFSVGIKALLRKFLKCRLRGDEILFCVILFTLTGVGACRFLSVNAYLGIAFFVLLAFAYAVKDASVVLCAFALSLPPLLVAGISPERFFVYGVALSLFVRSGRLAAACAFLIVFFAYGYFDGIYAYETVYLVRAILSAILPALLFILLPAPTLRELENRVAFYKEKHLSRIAINRNRAAIGEQLFEISAVFREIEATFAALGTNEAEEGAKEYIRGCVMEEVCKGCAKYRECLHAGAQKELDKLIEVGCLKGKSTLIDVPRRLAEDCVNQSWILYAVNRQIGDYRKYMTETENAASGRTLLANQAQGISEILKNIALEQSEPLRVYTEKEKALDIALLNAGIVCSEVLVYGTEENLTLSLITFGKADVKKIAAVASHLFQTNMIISERITLSQDKFCCILRKKPYFDAAFGVAAIKKAGEIASGDTHSVIKIDERRFMVALSDGMGSGEYARRISESTISLLESFYRAKMPSDLVLSTINKLLTFSKEETFACVDIAVVDLDSGGADIVKIGSPLGFILSGNTVKVLEGSSLPLGILDSLRPDTAAYELTENDVLLFLSDGVVDAFGSVTDLYETLRNIPIGNPQQLADLLLENALRAYGGTAKDDMTAVAVRLFKSPDPI